MTRKLYDTDSHLRAFETRVLSCERCGEGKYAGLYRTRLEETAFFAEGGGQASDRGLLGGQVVVDVQEEGEQIFHYLKEPLPEGETVKGEIDWDFRFDNMQQHSGEHVLSGIVYAWKGYHNVGFHLGEAVTTVDFDGPLSPEEVKELERKANQMVWANEEVRIVYPSGEELAGMEYRSKKELGGRVRIVVLGDIDLCACCAPHVRRTGEIGIIKIIRAEHYKGGMRLTIVCGMRAICDTQEKEEGLSRIAKALSVKETDAYEAFVRLKEGEEKLREGSAALRQALKEVRKRELLQKMETGGRLLFSLEPLIGEVAGKNLAGELAEAALEKGLRRVICLLVPQEEKEACLCLLRSEQMDVRPYLAALKEKFGMRGGGTGSFSQGNITGDPDEILAVLTKYDLTLGADL